ncbi:MAG: DUF4153 domain-containing protein [Paludibacter sp.]|nr:DUF4153 domain-containing protein [Paludibacter sp.]
MKRISLKVWLDKIQKVAIRFPFSLFFLLGLAFLLFLKINKHEVDINLRIWTFFSMGIAVSVAISLFSEEFHSKIYRAGLNILAIIVLLLYSYLLPPKFESVDFYQIITIVISFVLAVFFASFFKKNNDIPFWEFSKKTVVQLIIAGVFSQVLMLGLSLAILSLQKLFNINIQNEVYSNLAVLCYALFGPIYFLANLPDENEKREQIYTFDKFLKVLGLYIISPILALYTLILYVYLIQIMAKWELPNGWVSMLVSILGLGGFLTLFILYPLRQENENKWLRLFYRIFPLILIPLIVLMSVGIFRRFSDYGITINRCYVLLLNVWLFALSVYLFVSTSKHLKWIVITFAAVLFLASVGPWSVYSVTENKLSTQLAELFAKADMLENGKIPTEMKTNLQIDSVSQSKMIENIRYLSDNYGKKSIQPLFLDSIEDKSVNTILNNLHLNYESLFAEQDYVSAFLPSGYLLDIKGYDNMLDMNINRDNQSIFKDENVKVFSKKNEIFVEFANPLSLDFSINLDPKINELKALGQKNSNRAYSVTELTIDGPNYKLIISSITAQYSKEISSLVITECSARLFY